MKFGLNQLKFYLLGHLIVIIKDQYNHIQVKVTFQRLFIWPSQVMHQLLFGGWVEWNF